MLLRKAFTMIELTFAIVIIGILSAIAVPKFAATRDDAVITKARVTVSSLRNAINTEKQLRVLRGVFTPISKLDGGTGATAGGLIFDHFDGNVTNSRVLEYPMHACATGVTSGCWKRTAATKYTYYFPHNSSSVDFNSSNSRFDCVTSGADCNLLTQ